jgi:asparagine synthase (glutamine-hydrolysing)
VALSGDAGDEMFAGYRRYRWHGRAEAWRKHLPNGFRQAVFGAMGDVYPKLDWAPRWLRAKYTLQEFALDTAGGYYRTVCKIQDRDRLALYSPLMQRELKEYHPAALIAEAVMEAGTGDSIACAQYVDCKTYLPGDILTKVDRTSMANSLEVRVPMLDHEFVAWASALPRDLKLRGSTGKFILKRALEPYVPMENLYRPKQGFASPLRGVFHGDGARFVREALSSGEMVDCGLFDLATLSRIVEEHASGLSDHSKMLWSLLMFQGFLKEVHFKPRSEELRASELAAAG